MSLWRCLAALACLNLLATTCVANPPPAGGGDPIAQSARRVLANRLDLPLEQISLISQEGVDWPDACLGIDLPDQVCAQVVTPGFQLVLDAAGVPYQLHADHSVSQVLLAGTPGQEDSLAIEWSRVGGIAGFCDGLRVYMTGDVFAGRCPGGASEVTGNTLLAASRLKQLYHWASTLESFHYEQGEPVIADAMFEDLIFHGGGSRTPSLQEQTAILAFATALFAEIQSLSVGRPGPIPTMTQAGAGAAQPVLRDFAGLVYRTQEGLWALSHAGEPVALSDRPDARLSPAGTQIVFQSDDDLWITRPRDPGPRRLTTMPGRGECCPAWWPGGPGVLVFGSWPHPGAEPNTGHLSVVGLDGGSYRVLEPEAVSLGLPAPGPDGMTIAYDRLGEPWIYDWETGPRPFEVGKFRLGASADLGLASPSWSPDGTQLAWMAAGIFDGSWRTAVAVFDLQAGTSRLLHYHRGMNGDGWPPAAVWSPDNRWLALSEWDTREIWVLRADGSEERQVGVGIYPLWSPGGQVLVYTTQGEKGVGTSVQAVELVKGRSVGLDLPMGAIAIGWLPPD